MAAPCVRMLVSGRMGSCWGSLMGTAWRRAAGPRPSAAESAKSLHTKPSLRADPKNEETIYRSSIFVAGAKATNPMKKVGFAWAIGFPSGILLFLFAKNKVDKKRVQQMKTRQRMRDANKGEYSSERFSKAV